MTTLLRRLSTSLLLSLLWLGSAPAVHAAPFSIQSDAGVPGSVIGVRLFDGGTESLFAATLVFSYDPALFSVEDVQPGTLTGDFDLLFDVPLPGTLNVSLVTAGEDSNGEQGTLVEVLLRIAADAPLGPSEVSFRCFEDTAITCNGDYVVPLVTGSAVVVPLPAAAPLLVLALAGLPRTRRRRD